MLINTPVLCTFDLVTATLDKVTIAHWSLPYKIHLQATESPPLCLYSYLRYVRVLRATCRQAQPVVLCASAVYFTRKMTEKRYLSANITLYATHFLLKPPTHYLLIRLVNKNKILTHLPIIRVRICTLHD